MTKRLRCAIYTRKSSEEGLDQTFNSLDAQREACAAYILSQAGEGWALLKEVYDDGGFSGGSMERPALTRLLADIHAGKIDIVVVYKVDRLTRSLSDFARIVEILDKAKASFVSITQSFNTTNSMGRLTLNVLLSFAQFEREVTGERIRDKIAASKARGMWMGGNPSLGYDVKDRALHVNDAEATIVRTIFQFFLEADTVTALADRLARNGICSKIWTSRTGRRIGGVGFSRGALRYILKNRLYLGEIVHRGKIYPGQHPAIIERALFDTVQVKLAAGAQRFSSRYTKGRSPLLRDKLFDERNARMMQVQSGKNDLRYFYYAATTADGHKAPGARRVSAPRLEARIVEIVAPLLADHWRPEDSPTYRVFSSVQRVDVGPLQLSIHILANAARDGETPTDLDLERLDDGWRVKAPHNLMRPSSARGIIASGDQPPPPRVDRALLRAVVSARRWSEMLAAGEVASIRALAEKVDLCPAYTSQILTLAFLAPDLVGAILDGRQPSNLTLGSLLTPALPLSFADQRRLFGQFH